MTKANSLDPPKLATWLMEKLTPAPHNAPLAGDLMEAFKQGRSSSWYWRQVFWTVLIGLLNLFRKRRGRFAYALACGGLICAAWFSVFPMTGRDTTHQFSVTCLRPHLAQPCPGSRAQFCSPRTVRPLRKQLRYPVALVAGIPNRFSYRVPSCYRRVCTRCLCWICPDFESAEFPPSIDSCRSRAREQQRGRNFTGRAAN